MPYTLENLKQLIAQDTLTPLEHTTLKDMLAELKTTMPTELNFILYDKFELEHTLLSRLLWHMEPQLALEMLTLPNIQQNAHLHNNAALAWAANCGFTDVMAELLKIPEVKANNSEWPHWAVARAALGGAYRCFVYASGRRNF